MFLVFARGYNGCNRFLSSVLILLVMSYSRGFNLTVEYYRETLIDIESRIWSYMSAYKPFQHVDRPKSFAATP